MVARYFLYNVTFNVLLVPKLYASKVLGPPPTPPPTTTPQKKPTQNQAKNGNPIINIDFYSTFCIYHYMKNNDILMIHNCLLYSM